MAENVLLRLPQSVRDSLKCVECTNYLSVPPIVYHDKGLICGRCITDNYLSCQRATAYETLAQLFHFPCRNVAVGCTEEFSWTLIKDHENVCQFRLLRCPSLPVGGCSWNGVKNALLGHFSSAHKELVMDSSSYFYLPYKHDVQVNKLLIHENNFFLFQICNDITQGKCWLGLTRIDKADGDADSYNVEFKAAEHPNNMVLRKNIEHDPTASWIMDTSKMFSLDINTIKTFLDSNNIMCKLEITMNKTPSKTKESLKINTVQKSDETVLKELECLVCYEYMIPPIFLCSTGHSICGLCKQAKGVYKCPMCQSNITNTRNFTLENVTAAAKYPCKNKITGCRFVGNSVNIRHHEKYCVTAHIDCPFNCNWKGNTNNVIDHAQKHHNINTPWKITDTLFRNLRSTTILVDYYLIKYDRKVFKVGFKHTSVTGPVDWVVQELGRHFTDKPEYKFTLKFVDQSDMGRQFIINNLCYGIVGAGDFYNCTKIPYHLLKPYINEDDQLIYQLNIEKI